MNIANKITVFRLLLIPFFVIALIFLGIDNYVPGLIFLIASLTDFIDGYLARSRNLVTTFGKFLDPLADKMLVTAALIMLIELDKVAAWTVIIIVSREFIVTGFRVLAASNGVTIAASFWGKFKTITQFIAIIMFLFAGTILSWIPITFTNLLYNTSVILTLISGIDYIYKNIHVLDMKNI